MALTNTINTADIIRLEDILQTAVEDMLQYINHMTYESMWFTNHINDMIYKPYKPYKHPINIYIIIYTHKLT